MDTDNCDGSGSCDLYRNLDTYLLLALDAATGKEKFRVTANGYVYSSPTIAANTIFFGDFTGQLLAVIGMNKLYTLGPILSKPSIGNGIIYFGSADGCLYTVRLIQ